MVFDILELREYRWARAVIMAPESDEKTIAAAAIPEALIEQVMANIEQASR